MKIGNQNYQSIWIDETDPAVVRVIDQQKLPYFFETKEHRSVEERYAKEVTNITWFADGKIQSVRICPEDTLAANYGFDITPAQLITGLVTEKGICMATGKDIKEMFSDKFN